MIVGLVIATVILPGWLGIAVGLVFAIASTTPSLRKVRRRTLTVTDSGLELQRDQYAMIVAWDEVESVRRRRHQIVIPVEELVLSGSRLLARDSTGKPTSLPPSLSGSPATRAILISLYDKAWRHGSIGDHLPGLSTLG